MGISQSALAMLCFYALILGCVLGGVYDVLRITRVFLGVHYSRRTAKRLSDLKLPLLKPRSERKQSKLLGVTVFMEDLLFCILAGIALILLFYGANNGKIRASAFLCAGAGFLLYRATLGKAVMLFSEGIAFFVGVCFRYLIFFSVFPFRFLWSFIKRRAVRAHGRAVAKRQKAQRARFTATEIRRASISACGMVPEEKGSINTTKRGKYLGKGKKKTVQSEPVHAHLSGRAGGGFNRRICK